MVVNLPKKMAILIVEDHPVVRAIFEQYIEREFPAEKFDIIKVDNLTDAVKYLADDNHNIVGALVDNGFPLAPESERIGSESEDMGAGTLLVRFMRTGKFGALAKSNKPIAEALEKEHGDLSARYKNIPIVWNSAGAELGKIEAVRSAVNGVEIDSSDPKYKNEEKIPTHSIYHIDDHTAAIDKLSGAEMVEFFKSQLANQMAVSGRRATSRNPELPDFC